MAYITSESVKEIRTEIKKLFPSSKGWKFSITRRNYSMVDCEILQAPINLLTELEVKDKDRTFEHVNELYINSSKRSSEAKEVLNSISNILNTNNYDNSDCQSDYFDVGYYTSLSIGAWGKPFIKVN